MIIDISDDVYVYTSKLKKVTVIDLLNKKVTTEEGSIYDLESTLLVNVINDGEKKDE